MSGEAKYLFMVFGTIIVSLAIFAILVLPVFKKINKDGNKKKIPFSYWRERSEKLRKK
ncbi:MAG: hypothetical protein Q7R84_00425 [bacterium]|nr:hypothetical protein [bacterium]